MSLRSKKNITICRPIPAFIPRQVALGVLHDHSEVITLNPLVLSHHRIPSPKDAPADEMHSTWYEINERIQFIPGLGKAGSSTISFNGVFHDVPWGLQTHIYAPMNIDMRAQYRIAGSQAGVEAAAPRELGLEKLGAPKEGLYLRADIEFKCNIALASFVKSTTATAIEEMVNRMVKKAEQLDSDILQGMIREERESIVSRTQSKEHDAWQGQRLGHSQSYTPSQSQVENTWPGQRLGQSKSQVQELDTQPSYRTQQHRQQQQQNAYQHQQQLPPQRNYVPPTIVAELDGGQPALSDRNGWSQSTLGNKLPYPQVRPPSQERPSYHDGARQESYPPQHQSPPQQYQPYQYQEHVGQRPPPPPPPQHHQQGPPQFQESRKYSFDADRLQPETLNGASGRRWSAQYT